MRYRFMVEGGDGQRATILRVEPDGTFRESSLNELLSLACRIDNPGHAAGLASGMALEQRDGVAPILSGSDSTSAQGSPRGGAGAVLPLTSAHLRRSVRRRRRMTRRPVWGRRGIVVPFAAPGRPARRVRSPAAAGGTDVEEGDEA